MAADTDEDALSWKGDSDPTLATGKKSAATKPVKVAAKTSDAKASAAGASDAEASGAKPTIENKAETKPRTSSFLLVTYGILAGAYLIYTVGWIVAITKSNPVQTNSVLTNIMTIAGEYTAIASGALWFAGIFLLTRNSKAVVRLLWLLLGLVLLIPWPFVLVGVK